MSVGERTGVDVEFEQVAFGPVGGETEVSIANGTHLADDVAEYFGAYVAELVKKKDTTKVEHGRFGEGSEIEESLQALLDADNGDFFREISEELVLRLNNEMATVGGAAKGTLFVCNAQIGGEDLPEEPQDVVVLLKMDNMVDRRVFLSDESIGEINRDDAFPRSGRLQKGAIYPGQSVPPHTRRGDVKMYQNSESGYFRRFFDCETIIPSSLNQSRAIIDACRSIIDDELERPLGSHDVSQIISQADDEDGEVNQDVVDSALSETSDGEIDPDRIEQTFSEDRLREIQVDVDEFPRYAKDTVHTPDGKITVKYPIGASDHVIPEDDGSTEGTLHIEGERTSTEYVDR